MKKDTPQKELYRRHSIAGNCVYCGKPSDTGKTKCSGCNSKKNQGQQERNARRSRAGLCQCGKPSSLNTKRCPACLERISLDNKRRYDAKMSAGVCISCGRNEPLPIISSNYKKPLRLCFTCWMKRTSTMVLGTSKHHAALHQLLIDQNYLCPYSGRKLEIGANAVLDHKMPRSRFPELRHELSNLQWVDVTVNHMKHDMTNEEFLSLIGVIYHRVF